jgi:hypothetical protein
MQCDLVEISFTASVDEDPASLVFTDGTWDSSGDEPSEGDETCHNHGYPIFIRAHLIQREVPLVGT